VEDLNFQGHIKEAFDEVNREENFGINSKQLEELFQKLNVYLNSKYGKVIEFT
jgi:hypothetical protein